MITLYVLFIKFLLIGIQPRGKFIPRHLYIAVDLWRTITPHNSAEKRVVFETCSWFCVGTVNEANVLVSVQF